MGPPQFKACYPELWAVVSLFEDDMLSSPTNIGSVYPFYVYDGNRPLAPILRQRRCCLMYDVY
jgi:hypothetical protein